MLNVPLRDVEVTMLSILAEAQATDWSLLILRLAVAVVMGTSGFNHLKSPSQRAESLGFSTGFTAFLGLAELAGAIGLTFGAFTRYAALGLIAIMLGAVYMKAVKWKTGFWGEKSQGWHYDLLFVAMNFVIFCTGGGRFVLLR
jgi:putative oxidoreductase